MEQETRTYVLKITHDDHFNVVHPALEGLLGPDYFSDYSGETAYKIECFDAATAESGQKPIFTHDVKSSYEQDDIDPDSEDPDEDIDDIPNGVWKSEELDGLPTIPLSSMVRGLTEQERQALSDPLGVNE